MSENSGFLQQVEDTIFFTSIYNKNDTNLQNSSMLYCCKELAAEEKCHPYMDILFFFNPEVYRCKGVWLLSDPLSSQNQFL